MIALTRRRFMQKKVAIDTPYITEGLTFLLDGIDRGSDDSAWTDLAGGIRFPYVNGVTAGDNGVDFASGHSAMVADKGLNSNSKTDATIEVVWTYNNANNWQNIVTSNLEGLGFEQYYRYDFVFYCKKSTSPNDVQCILNPTSNRVTGKKLSVSYSPSVGYINGIAANNDGSRCFSVGNLSLGNNYSGRIFSVRLYNRVLTEADVLANYAVDRERFGTG